MKFKATRLSIREANTAAARPSIPTQRGQLAWAESVDDFASFFVVITASYYGLMGGSSPENALKDWFSVASGDDPGPLRGLAEFLAKVGL